MRSEQCLGVLWRIAAVFAGGWREETLVYAWRGSSKMLAKIVSIQMGYAKAGRTGEPERVCSSAESTSMPCFRNVER